MRPLLQPNVEIMIATAMMYSPALPRIASSAAVPTRSCGAVAIASAGGAFREAPLAGRYNAGPGSTPPPLANGRGRLPSLRPPPADPPVFPPALAQRGP